MSNAKEITESLEGTWHGTYGLAFCPAHHNTLTPALSVSDGLGGKLLVTCHAGCSFLEIMEKFRSKGLVAGAGDYVNPTEADRVCYRQSVMDAARKRSRQARRIWDEATAIFGTPADIYLRKRNITCSLSGSTTLRYHPACWHGPSAQALPAMVALVEGSWGIAVHRTFLLPDGQGKADVTPNKMMLGATAGGAVRLIRGTGPLVVAEGIETALSLSCGTRSVWAALSSSGLGGVILPARPGALIVATDGDTVGQKAGRKLAARAKALGWEVITLNAPIGLDWNDVLSQNGGAQ
jgi:hypothetical protein